MSDIEISRPFFAPQDNRSCEDKRGACRQIFGDCWSECVGGSEVDRQFLRVEEQRVCDQIVLRACLAGLKGHDDMRTMAGNSLKGGKGAFNTSPATSRRVSS